MTDNGAPVALQRAAIRWALVARTLSLSVAHRADAEPQKSESTGMSRHSHTGKVNSALEPAPPVARRLWADLLCMCGECKEVTLADCGCENAAQERKRIVEQVEKMGVGSPEREEAAYAAVLDKYVEAHGANAEVAYVLRHKWLDPLLTLGAGISGVVLIVLIVERLRSARNASGSKRDSVKHVPRPRRHHARKR